MSLSVFDIIGPVMIGPSSSHTAGAVRLGQMGRTVLDQPVRSAEIYLHGSFAETFKGHGTDMALVAGLMGMKTDDTRIPQALKLASQAGIVINFYTCDLGDVHPNTAKMELVGVNGRKVSMTGCSVGGGSILVTEIDDFPVEISGIFHTLLVVHLDQPGVVAQITTLLASAQVNIAQMRLSRQKKGAQALTVLETDQTIDDDLSILIRKLPNVATAMVAKPLA